MEHQANACRDVRLPQLCLFLPLQSGDDTKAKKEPPFSPSYLSVCAFGVKRVVVPEIAMEPEASQQTETIYWRDVALPVLRSQRQRSWRNIRDIKKDVSDKCAAMSQSASFCAAFCRHSEQDSCSVVPNTFVQVSAVENKSLRLLF